MVSDINCSIANTLAYRNSLTDFKKVVRNGHQSISFKRSLTQAANFLYHETAQNLLKEPNSFIKNTNKLLATKLNAYENEGREMGALPLLFFGVFYLMGTRYLKARNKDEKREILIRDIPSAFTAFMGVYALKRIFAKTVDNVLGIPSTFTEDKKKLSFIDWFSRKTGNIYIKNYDELGESFSVDSAEQLKAFNKYIPQQSGKKIVKRLPIETRKALEELKTSGFFSPNTPIETFLLEKPELKQKVELVLKSINERIVPLAKMSKVIPDAIATLATIGILGWGIPWFNIAYTHHIYKGGKNPQANKNLNPAAKVMNVEKPQSTVLPSLNQEKQGHTTKSIILHNKDIQSFLT